MPKPQPLHLLPCHSMHTRTIYTPDRHMYHYPPHRCLCLHAHAHIHANILPASSASDPRRQTFLNKWNSLPILPFSTHTHTHQGQGLPTSHNPMHMHGTATRTGHCCKSWEVLGCEQRSRQLPEEPLEQVGRVVGMNLVPAHEAGIEVSLQLLLQPLEKEGPPRSCL